MLQPIIYLSSQNLFEVGASLIEITLADDLDFDITELSLTGTSLVSLLLDVRISLPLRISHPSF